MIDLIVLGIVALLVGCAIAYIVREKKRGAKCIGCSACTSNHKDGGCHGNCYNCK